MKPQKWAQEKRLLGTTAGGGTYMLTLPKPWIEGFSLNKGDALTLSLVGTGIYVNLAPQETQDAPATGRLDIGKSLQGEALGRAVISRYIAGHNVIELTGEISSAQRKEIRLTAQRLIGAEILQETASFMLIHVLRDPQVLSVEQLLDYICDNVQGMLADASRSLVSLELERALGVVQRDERVDRFYLLMSRRLYAALRNPLSEVEHKISRTDFFNAHTVARQLERVADHAVKIAQATQALVAGSHDLPKDVAARVEEASGQVQALLEKVVEAFLGADAEAAHGALETKPQVEELLVDLDREVLALHDSQLAYHLGIAADSIGRVKDYAANIAELALNAVALQE